MTVERKRRIHLIEKMGFIRRVSDADKEYESGYWKVPENTATALVGGEIYFHKKQAEESFFGGRITGYRVDNEMYPGRIIFVFCFDKNFRGVSAGQDGWSMEKKIV
jgi:hypothetical protein